MIIGYDSKRAFQNKTGLGNYSRSLISLLALNFPENKHILFAPRQTSLFEIKATENIHVITPRNKLYKRFAFLWRRSGMVKDILKSNAEIYHGLSNELPRGIEKVPVKTVVTIHDLVFERFPETYNFDERYVHRWKIKNACKGADAIIAISKQTKNDLIDFYKVPADKIFTCYQSCNPIFQRSSTLEERAAVKKKYSLPKKYFLFVSSITARKNLIAICNAMAFLKENLDIPLVVIGDGKKEKKAVKEFMAANGIADKLIILNELPQSHDIAFSSAADFPAIYQQATAMIYPSIFEGFGLPVLEAMWSRVPVICSNMSSLPEVGGDGVLYFHPQDYELLAQHMLNIATNEILAASLRSKGFEQAQRFDTVKYANDIMDVYKSLL